MIDLKELRVEIDKIDKQIVELFQERMKISEGVAEYKLATDKPIFDEEREKEKVKAVKSMGDSEFNQKAIGELFAQIMAISRKRQYQLLGEHGAAENTDFTLVPQLDMGDKRVVFQGVEGAYSHLATKQFFGEQVDCFYVETFRDVMETIKNNQADYGVLAIENSTAGIVNDSYDLLVEYDNYIIGEEIVKVEHVLLGAAGSSLETIKEVYSHPQALMQCQKYLEAHREWRQVPVLNTAAAAKMVAAEQDITKASIASRFAGENFGLKILEDHNFCSETNSTRFVMIANQKITTRQANKISICFEVPHISGSLYNILSHFIYNNLSMNKIESRPLEGRNWEYRFFIDFEGNLQDGAVLNALRGIRAEAANLKILGNY